MFEEHMRRILLNWKSARRRNDNAKTKVKGKGKQKRKRKTERKHNLSNGTGKHLYVLLVCISATHN